jgi:hypothetical protein
VQDCPAAQGLQALLLLLLHPTCQGWMLSQVQRVRAICQK